MTDLRTLAELLADIVKAQRKLEAEAVARGDAAGAEKWRKLAEQYTAEVEALGQGHLLTGDDDAQRT